MYCKILLREGAELRRSEAFSFLSNSRLHFFWSKSKWGGPMQIFVNFQITKICIGPFFSVGDAHLLLYPLSYPSRGSLHQSSTATLPHMCLFIYAKSKSKHRILSISQIIPPFFVFSVITKRILCAKLLKRCFLTNKLTLGLKNYSVQHLLPIFDPYHSISRLSSW